jgi:hypothetical protein
MVSQLTNRHIARCMRVAPLVCLGVVLYACDASGDPATQPQPESAAPRRLVKDKTAADVAAWKRITLGTHKGVNAFRQALEDARMRVGDSADEILGRPAFPYSKTKMDVDLVVLSVAELGFEDGWASLADVHRRAARLGFELCPPDVGPQLRLAYVDQPVGEFLQIAMAPVATYAGRPVALTVGNAGTGLLLIGGAADPGLMLHASVRFVLVRPQHIALPGVR